MPTLTAAPAALQRLQALAPQLAALGVQLDLAAARPFNDGALRGLTYGPPDQAQDPLYLALLRLGARQHVVRRYPTSLVVWLKLPGLYMVLPISLQAAAQGGLANSDQALAA